MNRVTAWSLHTSTLLVGGTGIVYAWMRYFTVPADEFAVVGHPWQPHVQHLHVWTAPLLVFGIGLIWRDHVWRHYRRRVRDRRRSGLSMLLGCAPMIVSGYLIQTAVGENWRLTWIAVHLVASALFLAGYSVHQMLDKRYHRHLRERGGTRANGAA